MKMNIMKEDDIMKRLVVILLASLLIFQLTACTNKQGAIKSAEKNSSLEEAEKILQGIKEHMAKEVKPEYFESEEWETFVKSYWEGYNKGQEMMKNPEFKDINDIEY